MLCRRKIHKKSTASGSTAKKLTVLRLEIYNTSISDKLLCNVDFISGFADRSYSIIMMLDAESAVSQRQENQL